MWMEEQIGKRINVERVDEALGTAPSKIATGCPFCRVMLTDGVTSRQSDGKASEELEVVDVSQLLLSAVKRGDKQPAAVGASAEKGGEAEPDGKADVATNTDEA
ncbi:hypothetical protein ACZ91_25015 [Streptomyces regensis]|nr:hypothetical protein ACZ91_25015 [Streptomyces regensis]